MVLDALEQAKKEIEVHKEKQLKRFKVDLTVALVRVEVDREYVEIVVDSAMVDVVPVMKDLQNRGYYVSIWRTYNGSVIGVRIGKRRHQPSPLSRAGHALCSKSPFVHVHRCEFTFFILVCRSPGLDFECTSSVCLLASATAYTFFVASASALCLVMTSP